MKREGVGMQRWRGHGGRSKAVVWSKTRVVCVALLVCWFASLVGCGGDVRFFRCKGDSECGKNEVCACDGICRSTCTKEADCLEGEACFEGFCVHKEEPDNQLGQSCVVPGEPDACKRGRYLCSQANNLVCKSVGVRKAEECDGLDNDCNGRIDDIQAKPCANTCGQGLQICLDGKWKPCNALDSRPCDKKEGECQQGTEYCRNGAWEGKCIGGSGATKEQCDGKDNDCDGEIDEDFANKGKACTVGQGECERVGVWVCKEDKSALECTARIGQASAETCDGKDNDCDGLVDEALNRACENACGKGQQLCVGGQWTVCDAVGVRFCGKEVGTCERGIELCKSGRWTGVCEKEGRPQTEACDEKDNDCDGQIDEDWALKNKVCEVGKGACLRRGVWRCNQAQSGLACSATPAQPVPEVCDGKDNNCDGVVDEGLKRACRNVCGTGSQQCISGVWGVCDAVDSRLCGSISGLCKPGTEICKEGGWQGTCVGQVVGGNERCDGKDNDCDGAVDEDWTNLEDECFSPGVGNCRLAGKFVCKTDGSGSQCSVTTAGAPKPEVCDGDDNDCNGKIDDVEPTRLSGHTAGVTEVTFSPSGVYLLSASLDKTVRISTVLPWPAKFQRSLTHPQAVRTVAVSPTDDLVATGCDDHKVRLWKFSTGTLVRTLSGHSGAIHRVRFDRYGKVLATASADKTIKLWEISTGRLIRTLSGHTGTVQALGFGLYGKVVVSGSSDNSGRVWNLVRATANPFTQGAQPMDVVFAPNGREFFAAFNNGNLQRFLGIDIDIFDFHFSNTSLVRSYTGHTGAVHSVSVDHVGQFVISGGADKSVRVWNYAGGSPLLTLIRHTAAVKSVAINPLYRSRNLDFASGGDDNSVLLWNCVL